ncbi:hypothetical protein K435DRAFT_841242 [Dendrothele bispora CBS 962.96]|uniref:Uncharacterized protein n=1 Tax=Dendrothele bispora (strain CBS 962.96) TaxID=1314807 RepID=A0A4S8LP67_DENBC|nr:hypothetical protein K435DRAFT_841242 [Dendrothele bispora CBS 962.96]
MYEAESQQRLETYGRAARTLLHLFGTYSYSRPLSSPLPSQFDSELLAPHKYDRSSHKRFIVANLQGNTSENAIQHEALLWAHWTWVADFGMALSSMDEQDVNFLLMLAVNHAPVESTHVIAICDDHDSSYPHLPRYRRELPLHYCRRRIEGSRAQGDNIELERLTTCLTRPCTFSWFLENMASLHLYKLLINDIRGNEDRYRVKYDSNTPIHLQLLQLAVNVPGTWAESPDIVETAIRKMEEYAYSWRVSGRAPIINVIAEATLILQSLTQRLNLSSLTNEHFFVRQEGKKEELKDVIASYPLVPKPARIFRVLHAALTELDDESVRNAISADMAVGIVRRCFGILQYRFEQDRQHENDASWAYRRIRWLLNQLLRCSRQSIEWRNALWTAFLDADFLLVDIEVWGVELEAILELLQQSDDPFLGRILEYLLSDGNLEGVSEQSLESWGQEKIPFILARLQAQSCFIIPEERWNRCFDTLSRRDFSSVPQHRIERFKKNVEKFKTFIRNGRNDSELQEPNPESPLQRAPDRDTINSEAPLQRTSNRGSTSVSQPLVSGARGWRVVRNVVKPGLSLLGLKRRDQGGDVEMGDFTNLDAPAEGIATTRTGEVHDGEQSHSVEVDEGIRNREMEEGED